MAKNLRVDLLKQLTFTFQEYFGSMYFHTNNLVKGQVRHYCGAKVNEYYRLLSCMLNSENTVDIGWFSDGRRHRGYLNLSWLRENSYSASSRAKRKERTRPLVAVSFTLYTFMWQLHSWQSLW